MGTAFRLMTWNIWWRFGPDWRARQPAILDTLREMNADIIGLQEVWGTEDTDQAYEFAETLGMHSAFAHPSLPPAPTPPETADQVGAVVGLGLLSRWPMKMVNRRRLPSMYRPFEPVVIDAIIEHPAGPLRVINACIEWEPGFDADRNAQASRLARFATDISEREPMPVVLMGDLNAAPESPVLRPLQCDLMDAWQAAGGDDNAVTLSSAHPSAPVEAAELIDRRIDHIFLRPAAPNAEIVVSNPRVAGDHPRRNCFPSDHWAVVCDVFCS